MESVSQINFRYLPHELKARIHALKTFRNGKAIFYVCRKYHIYHHKIKPRTLRHNDKVERSYRNDNERFYSFLLSDLRKQGKRHLKRSNNIPMQILNYLSLIETRDKILNS